MKRAFLFVILLAGIGMGMLFQSWWGEDSKAPTIPDQVSNDKPGLTKPTDEDPKSDFEVFPILGTSDRITGEAWKAMLTWRENAEKLTKKNEGLLYINGPTSKKAVALTFDDGPDADITPQVLQILKEHQITATFFFKGNQVLRYKSLVQKVYDQGCLVESHAYSHQELSKMNRSDIDPELTVTDQAIKKVIDRKPGLIRPPFGEVNSEVLAAAKANQEAVILWSIDTLDWSQQDPEHIVDNVLKNVRAGDIILLHSREGQESTVRALPNIIKGLREQGFEMVDVASLIGIPPYQE